MATKQRSQVVPHEDNGFFGPDSITWKVWSYPTSLTVGFIRAVTVEELDPDLVAAVDKTSDIYKRPRTRYDRTVHYFALAAFGSTRAASKAADVLVRIHSKAVGTEPYGGATYDANAPHSQLWIHLTAWHSILYVYEKYGPGKLSEQEESRYWEECAVAAQLQTCGTESIPRTRDDVRAYFDEMRTTLSGSPIARRAMDHLLDGGALVDPLPSALAPVSWVVNRFLRTATIATMPRWMRDVGGLRQSRVTDAAVMPLAWLVFHGIHLSTTLEMQLLRAISPSTVPVVAPAFYDVAPENDETLTPAQARERYGYDAPWKAHLDWRAKQRERVLARGEAPSDAGLIESEKVLGTID